MTEVTIDPARVREGVRELLGPEGVGTAAGPAIARPGTVEETAALLRLAGDRRWRVLPLGAGVLEALPRGRGDADDELSGAGAPELVVSTARLCGAPVPSPGDLTVRAPAGVTLSRLQEAVAPDGQWLASDPPGGGGITLGGLVATGRPGPLAVRYGRPRDQLLGLTLVDGAGRVLRLGGQVVKNVAGYDLVRLSAGSRGALGVVTEVVFRLFPKPEEDRTFVWSRGDPMEAWRLGRALAALPLPLTAAELLVGPWGEDLPGDEARVVVRAVGSSREVAGMREALVRAVGSPPLELSGEGSEELFRAVSRLDGATLDALRVQVLPDRGGHLLGRVEEMVPVRTAVGLLTGTFRIEAGEGRGPEAIRSLAAPVRDAKGSLRLVRGPGRDWVSRGGRASDPVVAELNAGIVRAFDPAGILPGVWGDREGAGGPGRAPGS